jgi:TolB-like protein/DNA-binding winged helix-turn-helix (wHTH) protein
MDTRVGNGTVRLGAFRFDRLARKLWRRCATGDWEPVVLGSRASELLTILTDKPGEVVSRPAIMDAVWPGVAVEPNNLTVQIAALRRVLDDGADGDGAIQTVSGRGYRLTLPVSPADDLAAQPLPASPAAPDSAPAPVGRYWHSRFIVGTGALIAAALLAILAWHNGWLFSGKEMPRLSIVVLPFDNLSGSADDDYLTAGITDDLTTALSHIPGTFIISRSTAYSYRGKAEDIRRIGQDLGVRYAVRGSVRRFGPVLRVNVELGSTETGAQLWSDGFEEKVADLASGQEQIVIRMSSALNIRLADIEAARSVRERPANPDAFDLILRARAISLLPTTKETAAQALGLYEQALARDPNAVLALTGTVVAVLQEYYRDGISYDAAMDKAVQYLGRAQKLEPNSEDVLAAQSWVLDFQGEGLDSQRAHLELPAVSQRLIELYPNNPFGYFRLAVALRNQGKYDEAAEYFKKSIQLNPRTPALKTIYWNVAYCHIVAGHDRDALEWANRTMVAPDSLPSFREALLLGNRAVAYFRMGSVDTAKRLAAELNDRYPFDSWRERYPADPDSETDRARFRSIQDALKAAGSRDHLDPDADFGVASDDVLHEYLEGKTPMAAPGVTTVSMEQLATMLENDRPLVIDTMLYSWYRSVPGAIGLNFHGHTHGTFTDAVQQRLEQKLRTLTGGDLAKPIVAMTFNVAQFDGYNLALRIRHAGYTNVYWYRGGREAWEVAGKPEDVVRPADW